MTRTMIPARYYPLLSGLFGQVIERLSLSEIFHDEMLLDDTEDSPLRPHNYTYYRAQKN